MNVLVPVSDARTNEGAVGQAVDRLTPTGGTLYLVYTETPGRQGGQPRRVTEILERSAATAFERSDGSIDVETAYLARDVYLPSPHDHAAELARYGTEHDIDLVLLDPNYSVDATHPTLQPIRFALHRAGITYEFVAVPRDVIPPRNAMSRAGFVAVFSFVLYLVVAPSLGTFDLVTGIIGAAIAGVLFRNVTFETTPRVGTTVAVFVRGALYIPYLLGKILVANVQISYLVLHPSLPIEPHMDRVRTGLSGGLALTGMANSLTLTPGTLTVDADRDELVIHSITAGSRREVLTGERRRVIEFVYYGRAGMTPIGDVERLQAETVAGPIDAGQIDGGRPDD